jgi:exonuclease III
MNGLNQPDLPMYQRLLSTHQLVAFQETKFNKEDSLQTNEHFIHVADSGARCYWSDTTSPVFNERHGVGLVLSTASPFGEVEDLTARVYKEQLRNRYLLLKTTLGGESVYIHVVYAPDEPPQRGEFFRALPTHFDDIYTDGDVDAGRNASHLVVGDFNVTMDNFLDQASSSQLHPGAGREEMCDWLDALGLMDAWRFTHPDERDYTSPTRKNRLDYCFLTVDLLQEHLVTVSHVRDRKWNNEDHIPVEFRLQAKFLPKTTRSTWRCPHWLLKDTEVQTYLTASVEELADRIKIFSGANPGCLLDEHKRSDCIYLRRRWLELRNRDVRAMAEKVETVNDAYDLCNQAPIECNKAALAQAKADLQAHRTTLQERNESKKFAADLHQSERATSYFFRAPQQDCLRSPITEFKQEDGSVTDDPAEIASGHRRFWGQLFQSPSPDLEHLRNATYQPLRLLEFLRDTVKRLTPAQQARMDAPLTANDLYWAIMKSENGKAPGPDGLPIEYYKIDPTHWARIYEVIHDYQFDKGKMTKFQRRAHLSLLYKKGDRSDPGNYRPLTLLNHDAKLGPKVLAWRLGEVLPFLIHEDQGGFVPGRSIRHLLLRFQDIQELCKERYPDACAVLIDFAKAFDSVLWPALDLVLQHFGFGATFRAWVKTFYYQTSVSILLNNSPGDPFLLGAGVRQGDPLSPGLFVLFVEPMLNYLRARFSSRGINVDDMSLPHLLLAFADDCTGLLSKVEYAKEFLDLVQDYAKAAGLRLNVKKTCIMPFTKDVNRLQLARLREGTDLKVLGPYDTVVLLGILQGATVTAQQRLSAVITKLRARCAIWKYRARTLRGKVVLLQSIILPLLWYTASVTCVPASVLKTVDIIIRNFVHSKDTDSEVAVAGKFDKDWIYATISAGGLGLTPAKTFIQAMHLKCLRDGIAATCATNMVPRWMSPAVELFSAALGSLGHGFDILYANMKGLKWSCLPDFWSTTLRLWADLHLSHGSTDWKAFAQVMPFWYNFHFAFGKTKLPLADVSKATIGTLKALGFNRLQDFVDRYGDFATEDLLLELLHVEDFERPASRTLLISATLARFNLISPPDGPSFGPLRPIQVESATHGWSLDGHLIIDMTNRDFVKLLLKARKNQGVPTLQLKQLGLVDFDPPEDLWRRELNWDRHVLPVCADLKFRLQHNALGFRYKFGWHTEVITSCDCIHGCDTIENAEHLFWSCLVARYQWDFFLPPFEGLIVGDFAWQGIAFPGAIRLRPSAIRRYGEYAFQVTFSIVRCCVLRALWLHRNKRLYNPGVSTSSPFVQHHALAYIRLHLRKFRTTSIKQGFKQRALLVDQVCRAFGLVVTAAASTTTATTSATSTTSTLAPTLSTGLLTGPAVPRSPLSAVDLRLLSSSSADTAGPRSPPFADLGLLSQESGS